LGPTQRIARVDVSRYRLHNQELAGLEAIHRELQTLIRRHLPGVTASVLALPVPDPDGVTVDWYSDLPGQPQCLARLPPARRARAKSKLEDRLASLVRLADALPSRVKGSEPIAALLRDATVYPDDSHVYLIGDEPVVTLWGFTLIERSRRGAALGRPGASPSAGRWRVPIVLGLLAALIGLGGLGGAWYWLEQRRLVSLESELEAALAAVCAGPDRLGALEVRLDELDPERRAYAPLRARLAAEQVRCAAAAALAAQVAAADWDCARLASIGADGARMPVVPDEADSRAREPFPSILAGLQTRLSVCTRAQQSDAALARAVEDCSALSALDASLGRPAQEEGPLHAIRLRLDGALRGCAGAERIATLLDAAAESADGDCDALETTDREIGGLDVSGELLASLRSRLDAELARCALARRYREAVLDAQLDCVALRAVEGDLSAEDAARPPLRAIRDRLEEALVRCEVLDRLDQTTDEGVAPQ
jgi:hypothetical protein